MPRQPVDARGPGSGGRSGRGRGSGGPAGRARQADLPDGPLCVLALTLLLALLLLLLQVRVEARPRLVRGPDLDAAVDSPGGEAVGGAGPGDGGRLEFF